MRRFAALVTALAATALPALPAAASTMPRTDFHQGELTVGATAVTLFYFIPFPMGSLDYAVTDRLSLGVAASGWMALARATYRLAEGPWGSTFGLTAMGSFNNETMLFGTVGPVIATPAFTGATPAYYYPGRIFDGPSGQLALAATLPIGGPGSPVRLRAMFGPAIGMSTFMGATNSTGAVELDKRMALVFQPNVELAIRLAPKTELTLGGYGYAGLRHSF